MVIVKELNAGVVCQFYYFFKIMNAFVISTGALHLLTKYITTSADKFNSELVSMYAKLNPFFNVFD